MPYIFANNINEKQFSVKALGSQSGEKIESVSLLGTGEKMRWKQNAEELILPLPGLKKGVVNIQVFKVILK